MKISPFAPVAAVLAMLCAGFAGVAAPSSPGALSAPAGLKPIHPPAPAAAAKASSKILSVHSSASQLVVSPTPQVYLVFWGSQWSSDPAGAMPTLTNFFTGLFGSKDTYDTILAQYCEGVPKGTTQCGSQGIHIQVPSAPVLAGVWADNTAAAPNKATASQIAAEAVSAAGHFNNTTQAPNLNAQYVIASATGTHPDGFPGSGFCGYHSSVASAFGRVAFTNLPYVPDLGNGACTTISNPTPVDGLMSTETHEYAETVTDIEPSRGWLAKNGSGNEIGDECINLDSRITLSTGTFDVQGLWSNLDKACVTVGP